VAGEQSPTVDPRQSGNVSGGQGIRKVPRPGEGWVLCENHREFIAMHLANGVWLTKIRKLLKRQGVDISYPTPYRFAVARLDFNRGTPTVPAADCAPGE